MVVYTTITTAGVARTDSTDCQVESTVSEFGVSSNFSASFSNVAGRHKTDFTVGDEVIIKADTTSSPTTTIFTGIIEDINFEGEGVDETVQISGRDYTARLMDVTVEPEVYTNTEISAIVNDIFDKYTSGLTRTNVQVTSVVLPRINFNQVSVYDAFKRLADLAEYIFYVDVNKDLHFMPRASASTGLTLNNANIIDARFKITRDGIYNRVWVYGDRYLTAAPIEVFTPSGGSVFPLQKKPHNTRVEYLGSVKVGGVFNFAVEAGSTVQYLVNFEDKQVIFISGTQAGNNVPGSNVGSIVVNYDADFPIVKFGENRGSINAYGPLTRVIQDKNIKDPRIAQDRLLNELTNSEPPKRGDLYVKGTVNVTPGNTVVVDLPNFNINTQTYDILSARWEFNTENNFSEKVLTLTLNKKIQEVTDKMAQLFREVKEIQAGDISDTDLITRFEFGAGSYNIVGSFWVLKTRTLGSSWILGDKVTGSVAGTISRLGLLGSKTGSVCFLGDSRSALVAQASGGYYF